MSLPKEELNVDDVRWLTRDDLLAVHADAADALEALADVPDSEARTRALEATERLYDRLHPAWEQANRNRGPS